MTDIRMETLLMVIEKQSFTRAAEELSLTQPAISHQIRDLEREMGTKLIIRGNRELKLTTEGEVVVRYARRIKAMYDKMRIEIADAGRHLRKIRIGITHTAESNMVAEVLAKYSNENPGAIITIITQTINNLYIMLENYELDLAIVEGKVVGDGLNSLMLDTDSLVCVVSTHNPLAHKSMVTLSELKKQNMILRLPQSNTRNIFVANLASINESIDSFNVILEVDNIATIKDLIRKDLGISILPQSTCMDELRKGKIVVLPIENMNMLRETCIVYQKDFSHMDILRGIVELYQKTVKRHVV